jgi:hypothetical protein
MKRIDGRDWKQDVKDALSNAAVSGGAIVDIDDNSSVLVVDARLWESIQDKLPTISDIIRNLRSLKEKG